jgi:hypothetical protein
MPVNAPVAVSIHPRALAAWPWLPPRALARSVWLGPDGERLRIREDGGCDPASPAGGIAADPTATREKALPDARPAFVEACQQIARNATLRGDLRLAREDRAKLAAFRPGVAR